MYIIFGGWTGDESIRGLGTLIGQYDTLAEAQRVIDVSRNDMGGCDWFHLAMIRNNRLVQLDGSELPTLGVPDEPQWNLHDIPVAKYEVGG